ncbi:hypothetical protein FJU30_22600 [Affinibrenneria salicis]|uniref:RcnB family protein n=1 Tax=Affinibrenneria salicis TaxID=2590031 RepID=A0A5J5FU20_9GAMM|nr:RcnB family protein [Affinibrenneria salicis]KAA8996156.1 hypothetical protein FJU30_22600 [Affinibrenneria salicis]
MNKKTLVLVISLFTVSGAFSTSTLADGPGRQWQHGDRDRRDGGHRDERRGPGGRDFHDGRRDRGGDRFAWHGHDFRRGHPVPPRYRGDSYRVNDWRTRGLYRPPVGQHWAYIDGNYVLIAAATGIITAMILGNAFGH